MTNIFSNFLLDIIGDAGLIGVLDDGLSNFLRIVFNLEGWISEQVGSSGLDLGKMWLVMYGAGISLLTVKCLKKGFEQYILWTEGDPSNPPGVMVIRAGKAIAIAACFPVMYTWLVDITMSITNSLLGLINIAPVNVSFAELIMNSFVIGLGMLLGVILTFIYLVLFLILTFMFIKKGVEMMVLRLGVPLGVVGYIDSDGGLSKNYFKIFFQCAITAMLQVVFFKISVGLWVQCTNPIVAIIAIVFLGAAISAPKFIAQFLVPSSGGGGMISNVYYAANMARGAAAMFKK